MWNLRGYAKNGGSQDGDVENQRGNFSIAVTMNWKAMEMINSKNGGKSK